MRNDWPSGNQQMMELRYVLDRMSMRTCTKLLEWASVIGLVGSSPPPSSTMGLEISPPPPTDETTVEVVPA